MHPYELHLLSIDDIVVDNKGVKWFVSGFNCNNSIICRSHKDMFHQDNITVTIYPKQIIDYDKTNH